MAPAEMMTKKRRVYISRVVGDQVMTSADLERLHKYMLEIEGVEAISDEMRAVVEELWPELVHKLPPKMPPDSRNRIMIFGPKSDGTYVIEFRTAAGEALAISIPRTETAVVKYFQERMPYGLFVPDVDHTEPPPY
jgi:hypothetical protein